MDIGTSKVDLGTQLTVAGNIHAHELKVKIDTGAGFVFTKDHADLKSEASVNDKHLPGIPAESEMKRNKLDFGTFQIKLLQKDWGIDLVYYEQNKRMEVMEQEPEALKRPWYPETSLSCS